MPSTTYVKLNHQHHLSYWCLSIVNINVVLNFLITLRDIINLNSRFLLYFSLLQNNNLTRIPDYAFKNQRALEVMYVRK